MHYLNKDLEESSRIAGKIVTAGSEVRIQHWECVTDTETARACLQAVTLFAPTVYSYHSSLTSDFLCSTFDHHYLLNALNNTDYRTFWGAKRTALLQVVQTGDTKQGNK